MDNLEVLNKENNLSSLVKLCYGIKKAKKATRVRHKIEDGKKVRISLYQVKKYRKEDAND